MPDHPSMTSTPSRSPALHGTRLAGKVALVTGGAGGIGQAIARLFCAQGARVMLVDRDGAALAAAQQAVTEALRSDRGATSQQPAMRLQHCCLDIALPESADAAVAATLQAFGQLDVLVNNAALRNLDPVAEADNAKWQALLQVNLLGAVHCCRAALPALRRQGSASLASIVNVSSTYAVVGRKGFAAYDASKAALLSLTRSLAWEEAAHGVRVNAVCPGGTLTPYTIGRAAQRGLSESDLRAGSKADSLLRRWAEPMEVAWPVLWLASDEASFMTGTSLMVDGGTAAM
jgi:meso-butanediol dehydrogenase/(S,S)-butanediol dehydrogenase/diacetyl reductase